METPSIGSYCTDTLEASTTSTPSSSNSFQVTQPTSSIKINSLHRTPSCRSNRLSTYPHFPNSVKENVSDCIPQIPESNGLSRSLPFKSPKLTSRFFKTKKHFSTNVKEIDGRDAFTDERHDSWHLPKQSMYFLKNISWVPDNLAEKCYACQVAFTLVLRRHHCRRCGNVFCDSCSSSRMPIVSANIFTPVRVCDKCSVAARKAYVKMVEEKQNSRERAFSNGYTNTGRQSPISLRASLYPEPNSSSEGIQGNGTDHFLWDANEKRRATCDESDSVDSLNWEEKSLLCDEIPKTDEKMRQRHYNSIPREQERDTLDESLSQTELMFRRNRVCVRTIEGESVLLRTKDVRIQMLHLVDTKQIGTLYVTNYRIVFSPHLGKSEFATSKVIQDERNRMNRTTKFGARRNLWETEVKYHTGLGRDVLTTYQAIPLLSIERAKRKEMVENDTGILDLVCKDFRRVQFTFEGLVTRQIFHQFDRTYRIIREYSLQEGPIRIEKIAFARYSQERISSKPREGCVPYNAKKEFDRLGVTASNGWRLSERNMEYSLCETYPSLLAIPANVSDEILCVAARYRSKRRIPTLCWRDVVSGASISRSSQPLVGLGQRQCDYDVFLIQTIAAVNPSSSKLVIIDARPWKNAVAQKTVGRAGYELTARYETRHNPASLKDLNVSASLMATHIKDADSPSDPIDEILTNLPMTMGSTHSHSVTSQTESPRALSIMEDTIAGEESPDVMATSQLVLTECKLIFMGIENIHVMRKSYMKLSDLCTSTSRSCIDSKWLDQMAATRWMEHLSRILDSAIEIARIIHEQQASVLVHCSDGWDRTAQLTSLAQLLLDPYYRTIKGFQVLIEKEWCSFGHKFRDRTGHGICGTFGSSHAQEISPIFLQFIDCVWQIQQQFPCAFEFNERFLILILDHLHSCRFGTFLYNCEKERVQSERNAPTNSLWEFMDAMDASVIQNVFYQMEMLSWRDTKANVVATRQCYEVANDLDEYKRHPLSRAASVDAEHDDDMNMIDTDSSSHSSRNSFSSSECADENAASLELPWPKERDRRWLTTARGRHGHGCRNATDIASTISDDCSRNFHRVVCDLDYGISFPDPLDVCAILAQSGPQKNRQREFDSEMSAMPSSRSRKTPVRRFSAPAGALRGVSRDENCINANGMDQMPLWTNNKKPSGVKVLFPCASLKVVQFWNAYYLRWDLLKCHKRDADLEMETLGRDLRFHMQWTQLHVALLKQQSNQCLGRQCVAYKRDEKSACGNTRKKTEKKRKSVVDTNLNQRYAQLLERRRQAMEMVEMAFEDDVGRMLSSIASS
ncbi:hypothetical protein ABG067_000382 [Albugo candida]